MPTVDANKKTWDGEYQWTNAREGTNRGDEWSAAWGGPAMQWYGAILPRIHHAVPADSILEIACGYGRWTQFLKDMCRHLAVIDLSEECIDACRQRFSGCAHIDYHLNDGKSLQMIPDASVDFVFSFDSLVHADESVMNAYISQLPRILRDGGVAFLHHSNLGEYQALYARIRGVPKLEGLLTRLGVLEKTLHWRDPGVNAQVVERLAQEHGLQCISQEVIPWGTKRAHIDCFSTIVKDGALSARGNRVFRNAGFMHEARKLARLSKLYTV
jgi:ubiquinone/menaquinone biosynthesis C-methylase UbiE